MNKIVLSFIVIGAGGTGTYFLKEFSRYLSGIDRSNLSSLLIFDGDTVEEKNLSRQAFTEEDLGLNKAAVMADILNQGFGLDWQSYGIYLTDEEQISSSLKHHIDCQHIPVVIGCIDNHPCRLILERFFDKSQDVIYLDSANELTSGEVIFSYKSNNNVLSPVRSFYFPEIKRSGQKSRTEMSCEELNNVSPQHIATNMAAGNILLREACSIIEGHTHPGMVTFDLGNFYQEYIPYRGLYELL